MSWPSVDELVERYGYTREAAEREHKRATCAHEYPKTSGGTLCMWTAFGCTQTCVICGQITVTPNHCGQYDRARAP